MDEQIPAVGTSTAVELARLSGRIDQVITDHERRLTVLETRQSGTGTRVAAIAGPILALVALALTMVQPL